MEKRNTVVLFGGRSAEHEISIRSAVNIIKNLHPSRHHVRLIGVDRSGGFCYHSSLSENPDRQQVNEALLQAIIQEGEPLLLGPGASLDSFSTRSGVPIPVDVVFSILHGSYGEDGKMQGLLEILDLPYVGPDLAGSVISMDKELMKRLLKDAGIPSARYLCLWKNEKGNPGYQEAVQLLGSTLFVKPARQGSSVGVHRVKNEEEWRHALADAFRYDRKILVEEEIVGREIECAVSGNEIVEPSVIGEIVPEKEFYSYEAKYLDESGARLEMPANLPEEISGKFQQLSVQTYRTLQCEGMARVDGFLKENGEIYINEINTLPGFTSVSMYPVLWEKTGRPFESLMDHLVLLAEERKRRDGLLETRWQMETGENQS